MARKDDLLQAATDAGITVPDGATVPQIEALIEAASAAAHEAATIAALFEGGSGGNGVVVDTAVIDALMEALTVPGSKALVPGSHDTKGAAGSYGYAVRAALAETEERAAQWYTSKVREHEGRWYVQLTYRTSPTKDRTRSQ